jgi:hypothetical protein
VTSITVSNRVDHALPGIKSPKNSTMGTFGYQKTQTGRIKKKSTFSQKTVPGKSY